MNGPRGVAVDAQGNLWVADMGNNRILHFPAAVLNATNPAADFALGQPDLHSASPDHGAAVSASGFNQPTALAFDAQNNLYVADYLNARVLKFPSPVAAISPATVAYGQPNLTSRGVLQLPTSSSMAGPTGVTIDASGTLFAAVRIDNRVLVFAPSAASGAAATRVLGQPNFTTVTSN